MITLFLGLTLYQKITVSIYAIHENKQKLIAFNVIAHYILVMALHHSAQHLRWILKTKRILVFLTPIEYNIILSFHA